MALVISVNGQFILSGKILDDNDIPIPGIQIHDKTEGKTVVTNEDGRFQFMLFVEGSHEILVFGYGFKSVQKTVFIDEDTTVHFKLTPFQEELDEMVFEQEREEFFNTGHLEMVEGTAIYAGKKTEVILLNQMVGNKAANNPRQIYSQVVGLNIYENGDAGLQLSVGGRGLDPNRTANFNTRQNGYDISADVLGYPESYYTPPAEALHEIQIVRGAASLQYGTQFGGLINFKMKSPSNKSIELISRQSLGSFNLFTTFNSISGTKKKFSYYTYFHRKTGDGFRPNTTFHSDNFFVNSNYQLSDRTKISFDYTHLNYLAQQAGGLTDDQFAIDPTYSNRTRNWFEVNWNLAALKFEHTFSSSTEASFMLFGLNASRNALGFRGDPFRPNKNPITEPDAQENDQFIFPRDLIKSTFRNAGAEFKFLTRYSISDIRSVLLLGSKIYKANNTSRQGSGSFLSHADFEFDFDNVDYPNQSNYTFPNYNTSFFGENIFFLTDKLAVTPGVRFEIIETKSMGSYNQVNFDNAWNPISNEFLEEDLKLKRAFVLFGVGVNYDLSEDLELYGNFSQNYRSVTFSDIRIVSNSFEINPNLSDESGYSSDIGLRGKFKNFLSFEVGLFRIGYNDRIANITNNRAKTERKNVGDAAIYGSEIFGDVNLMRVFNFFKGPQKINFFLNTAIIGSAYEKSVQNGIAQGNQVEFIPIINLKSGFNICI